MELEDWEILWDVQFDTQECEHITFTERGDIPVASSMSNIHWVPMLMRNIMKYLRVVVVSTLTFTEHVSAFVWKATSCRGFIRWDMTAQSNSVRAEADKQLVCPALKYAGVAWDFLMLTLERRTWTRGCTEAALADYVCKMRATDCKTTTTGLTKQQLWEELGIVDDIADWVFLAHIAMMETLSVTTCLTKPQ